VRYFVQVPADRFDEIVAGKRKEEVCWGDFQPISGDRVALVKCNDAGYLVGEMQEIIIRTVGACSFESDLVPPPCSGREVMIFGVISFSFELIEPNEVEAFLYGKQIITNGRGRYPMSRI
jgi:hypothetical protein